MMQLVLVVLGVVMSLGSCGVAWRGRHLPVYVATLGPLTLLVAGRRPLAMAGGDASAQQGWELVFKEDFNASRGGGGWSRKGAVGGSLERGECVQISAARAALHRTQMRAAPQ